MVTGFFLSASGSGGGASARSAIGNPLSGTRRRRRPRDEDRRRHSLLVAIASLVLALLVYAWIGLAGHAGGGGGGWPSEEGARGRWEAGPPARKRDSVRQSSRRAGSDEKERRRHQNQHQQQKQKPLARPSSIDAVVRYLNHLASLPPSKLWDKLGMEHSNYGDDPFSLSLLEQGSCPWATETTVEWLPPRPHNSDEIAAAYRNNLEMFVDDDRETEERWPPVVLWYEHLSKAGGTTFCGVAKSNMPEWQVPRYHCMPGKLDNRSGRKLMDGRVGSWPIDELVQHVHDNGHAIVSNEWEPFSLEKLDLSQRRLDGAVSPVVARPSKSNNDHPPQLLFLTTLRDPSDRLLSAFTFFGLTVTEGRRAEKDGDPPTFRQWIGNTQRRLGRYRPGSMQGFRANTARYNHIAWRFSGGQLTSPGAPSKGEWERPFETAVRALAQYDLVLPMDVMTADRLGKEAIRRLLGWDEFRIAGRQTGRGDKENGHVVTIGGIKNSNAREYFNKDEYRSLWEANWLDHLLYLWCRAVFLARLHCGDM